MPHILQRHQDAQELARGSKISEQIPGLLCGAAPTIFVSLPAREMKIDRRDVIVDRAIISDPPAANKQRIQRAPPQVPFHVLPQRREAYAKKFAAIGEDVNLVVRRHTRKQRIGIERIAPRLEAEKLTRQM